MLAKIVVNIFGFVLLMILSIVVMIYGWGLEPKSWFWIIGVGIISRIILELMMTAAKIGEKG